MFGLGHGVPDGCSETGTCAGRFRPSPEGAIPRKITSDAGLLAYRELDHALGLTGMAGSILTEARRGKNIRHLVEGLFRQSVFGRLVGYGDVNDAERLSLDPAMRTIVDARGLDRNAALLCKLHLPGRGLVARRIVAFYNQRGTAEQHIKEGKNAINWTRLSCHGFRNNEVRLQLHVLAYNMGDFLRTLALPDEIEHWSMTSGAFPA